MGTRDSLDAYIREVNDVPLLFEEEERQLVRRLKTGDMEARNALVRANLRLVVNIARTYQGNSLGLADLIEEGNCGLLRAVEKYGLETESRFGTFAGYWVRKALRRAVDRC
jgi:RNA polymerase primary sigma factor